MNSIVVHKFDSDMSYTLNLLSVYIKGTQPDGGWPSTVNHNLCVIIQ